LTLVAGEIIPADETHYLGDTISLGPEHSGTASIPLVIRGQPGTRPKISGARRVECRWEKEPGSAELPTGSPTVLSCDLSEEAVLHIFPANHWRNARLYWIPEPGVDPETALIEPAVLPHLIEANGSAEMAYSESKPPACSWP
jgi:hypothetical protein